MGRGPLDGLCGVGGVCACGLGRVRSQRILILASICGLLTFFFKNLFSGSGFELLLLTVSNIIFKYRTKYIKENDLNSLVIRLNPQHNPKPSRDI
jgi:hypothetical protein